MAIWGGKATKQTRFGKIAKERLNRTIRSAQLCQSVGLSYHVIDAEWKWNYLLHDDVATLIENSQNVKTVLTFSSRHLNSLRIMRQSLASLEAVERISVGLVVGNKAYLNWREIRRPLARTLRDFAVFIRSNFQEMEVFIGTERILGTATKLANEFNLVPFLLLGKNLQEEIATVKDHIGHTPIAVYVPFLISSNYPRLLRDILYRLGGYILRRNWVQVEIAKLGFKMDLATFRSIVQEKQPLPETLLNSKLGATLESAAKSLAIWGSEEEVLGRLRLLKSQGAEVLVGLPIKENDEQIEAFGSCIKKLNA